MLGSVRHSKAVLRGGGSLGPHAEGRGPRQSWAPLLLRTADRPRSRRGPWRPSHGADTHRPSDVLFSFPFPVPEGSYLRVRIYPLTPTKTSTLSQNRFHLPGIE